MRVRTRFLVLGAMLGASSLAFACSALLDLEPPPTDVVADTGSDVVDENPTIDPGCPVRYVSTNGGNDANDGCAIDRAFQTITAAIAAVDKASAQGYDIRVAGGNYAEDFLTINLPGTLSGGWASDFKSQIPATALGGTVLRLATPGSMNKITLSVSPKLASGTPVMTHIFGLKVIGPSATSIDTPFAVRINASTTPIQMNGCNLIGGDVLNSRALVVVGATPDVFGNTITSGTATGALAVELNNSSLAPVGHFHGNSVTGGSAPPGTNVINSQAINVMNVIANAASGNAIEDNEIHIQSGTGTGALMSGISTNSSTIDLLANTITSTGGSESGESTAGIVGVNVGSGTIARIAGNRISSGGGGGSNNGDFFSIKVAGATSVVIENNMIFAGQENSTGTGTGTATGIYISNTQSVLIADNSIYTGYPVGVGKSAFGIFIASTQDAGVVIEGNILAAAGDSDWGIKGANCPGAITALRNNLFVGQSLGTFDINGCSPDAAAPSPKDIAGIAPYVMSSSNNRIAKGLQPACSPADQASGACLVLATCGPAPSCTGALFAGFSGPGGAGAAFDGGWQLDPQVPCEIGSGGLPVVTEAGTLDRDYYGAMRPNNVGNAFGAAQLIDDAGACAPP